MHRGPYARNLRPSKQEPAIMKRYRYFGLRKQCGHARIVLSCKHCIEAARFEAMWNKMQQRSAS